MLWRLVAWFVLAVVHRRVALAGDHDRERAAADLREGYAGGQLTLDEFSRRTGKALSARSHWQLRRSVFGLPRRSSVLASLHDVVLVVVTGAYVVFTLALALMLGAALLLGASTSTLIVFGLVWVVPTSLFVRFRRRH